MLVGHVLEAWLDSVLSSLIPPALSSFIDGAEDALKEKLNELNPAKEFVDNLKDWAKNKFEDWMPDASELERIEKDINTLLKDTETWGRMSFQTLERRCRTRLARGRFQRKPMAASGRPMTTLRLKARFPWM